MTAPMLEVRNLYKYFPIRQSLTDLLRRKPADYVKAVLDTLLNWSFASENFAKAQA